MQALTLYELNLIVRDVLQLTLADSYWVTAEIASCNRHTNGHVYLDLVEQGQGARGGSFKAKARANLWRDTAHILLPRFEQATGQRLQAGLKVLLQVSATFHEEYGFAYTVLNIDPTYTLGDMAQRRAAILQQLDDEGVLTLNKELPLPRPLLRIAIVSAEGAAGYGDFVHQLQQSGFPFHLQLFPATMQGERVEPTIIAALNRIAEQLDHWDAVVIIRGGGAVSDLNGFESYALAANVAQFPLPIITGIGHERDDTIVDAVAHTRCKTPTAVAAFLIGLHQDEQQTLAHLRQRLLRAVQQRLYQEQQQLDRLTLRYHQSANAFASREQQQLHRLQARLQQAIDAQLLRDTLRLEQLPKRINAACQHLLLRHEEHLRRCNATLTMADPQRILSLGYSLTTDADGRIVRSAHQLPVGSTLHTRFADGQVESRITSTAQSSL